MDRLSLDTGAHGGRPAGGGGAGGSGRRTAPGRGRTRGRAPSRRCPAPAAMLRVNADTLDHLINESGEVSIARSRVEAELRAVKQSIADLHESIARLRAQLREVEIQADSQMQSRASPSWRSATGEFDPLEFDRYTRLQELTRLMAESLHDADVDPADAAQEPGRDRRGAGAAGAHQPRRAAGADAHARGAVLDPRRAAVPDRAPDHARAGQEGRAAHRGQPGRARPQRAGPHRRAAGAHAAQLARARRGGRPRGRAAAGKPEAGRISISLRQEGNEIVLVVGDDGAGLDLEQPAPQGRGRAACCSRARSSRRRS